MANKLADALAFQQQRRQALTTADAALADLFGNRASQPEQPLSAGDYLENLSIGLGRGFESQLEGAYQLARHPIESGKAMYQAGKQVVQNPAMLAEALKSVGQQATSGPIGLGQVAGEYLNPRSLMQRPMMKELDVYHGTPHRFPATEANPLGEFDASKIGTGEGAQAYGHGLYFAENPDVAKGYQVQNAYKAFDLGPEAEARGIKLTAGARGEFHRQASASTDPMQAARRLQNANASTRDIPQEKLAELFAAYNDKGKGRFYHVDLPDEMIDRMLDWDKPLSEQPESVRKAISDLGVTPESLGRAAAEKVRKMAAGAGVADWAKRDLLQEAVRLESAKSIQQISGTLKRMPLEYGISRDSGAFKNDADDFLALVKATQYVPNMDTGGGAYALLSALKGGDKAASELLRSYGSPGIKYLDAGSRDGGSGTRNFVVFPGEEKKARILERK